VYLTVFIFLRIMDLRMNLFIIDLRLLIEWVIFRVNSTMIEILILMD